MGGCKHERIETRKKKQKPMPTEPTLKEKTAKGLFWGGISSGVQQLLGFVFGIVLLRLLEPSDYGMVGMLSIFSSIASTIMDSGFTTALTNKKEVRHEDYNAVFWFALFCGIFFYAVLFFCAPLIADFYDKPELTDLSRVVFLGIPFSGIGYAHNAYLFKNLMVKERAKIDVFSLLTSSIIGLPLAFHGFAYWALAIQGASYIGVGSILRTYYSPWRPTMEFNIQPLKEMFVFSSKLLLTNVFQQINGNIFSVILGRSYAPAQVGYYTQGQKWQVMAGSFLSGMYNGVVLPILAEVNEEKEKLTIVFRKLLRFCAFTSFPAMLGLAFVAEDFIFIVAGEKWLPATPFLQLFSLSGAFYFLFILYTNILIAHGKSSTYMKGVCITGLLQLLIVFATYSYGLFPMLVSYILVGFIALFGWHYAAKKHMRITLRIVLIDIGTYLVITLFSLFIAWIATNAIENIYIAFVLKIIITALSYTTCLYLLNSVIFKECLTFLKQNKK